MLLNHETGEMTNDMPDFGPIPDAPASGGSSMPTGLVSDADVAAVNSQFSAGGGAGLSSSLGGGGGGFSSLLGGGGGGGGGGSRHSRGGGGGGERGVIHVRGSLLSRRETPAPAYTPRRH